MHTSSRKSNKNISYLLVNCVQDIVFNTNISLTNYYISKKISLAQRKTLHGRFKYYFPEVRKKLEINSYNNLLILKVKYLLMRPNGNCTFLQLQFFVKSQVNYANNYLRNSNKPTPRT